MTTYKRTFFRILVTRLLTLLLLLSLASGLIVSSAWAAPPLARGGEAGDALPHSRLTPLGNLLNPDGTLNLETGFIGSLDPTGWRMTFAADGAPRFVPAAPPRRPQNAIGDDSKWDDVFGSQGADSHVYAIAVDATHHLVYIGGYFSALGTLIGTNHLGVWDDANSKWSALGMGANGSVYAIAVDPNTYDVYVGGEFGAVQQDASTSITANRVAVWHYGAQTWGVLGTSASNGVSGGSYTQVNAIAIDSRGAFSYVYVGGDFDHVADKNGSQAAGYVARFYTNPDDWTWSVLGSSGSGVNGANGVVYALAMDSTNGLMYVGGLFNTVYNSSSSTVSANNVASWNIDSSLLYKWSNLGSGTNSAVYALAVNTSASPVEVYVGGGFTTAGGSSINHIGVWTNNAWYPLGTSASNGADNSVRALLYDTTHDYLYVAGEFTHVSDSGGSTAASYVAYWHGGWNTLGSGFSATCRALGLDSAAGKVYAGGDFTTAGGVTVNYVTFWEDAGWRAMGQGLSNSVYAVVVAGSDVYAGGAFLTAGGVTVNYVAWWDGVKWSPLGGGVNSMVFALAYDSNYKEVYVGGGFTQVTQSDGSTLDTNYIAKWNTQTKQWSQLGNNTANGLGGGLSPSVRTLLYDANAGVIYAGGGFTQSHDPTNGTQTVNHLARWLPAFNKWQTVGSGVNGTVYALTQDSDHDLFVGGDFDLAGGSVTVSYIAKWNGSAWSWMADGGGTGVIGVGDVVYALDAHGNDVYVGGNFTSAGNKAYVEHLAKWDDSTQNWSYLGGGNGNDHSNGVNDIVRAIAVSGGGNYVHAGGDFTTAYNNATTPVSTAHVAVWNTSTAAWDTYGSSGVNDSVRAIAFGGSSYLGGDFGTAGSNTPSRYFARFTSFAPTVIRLTDLRASAPAQSLPWMGLLLLGLGVSFLIFSLRKLRSP